VDILDTPVVVIVLDRRGALTTPAFPRRLSDLFDC